MSSLKIIADRSICVGAGQCVIAAGKIFTQSEDDGLVVIKVENPGEEDRAAVELAVNSCPTLALTLKG